MIDAEVQQLRAMLEEIDGRLLATLADGGRLDEDKLTRVALYEIARGSVLRVLAGAEGPRPR